MSVGWQLAAWRKGMVLHFVLLPVGLWRAGNGSHGVLWHLWRQQQHRGMAEAEGHIEGRRDKSRVAIYQHFMKSKGSQQENPCSEASSE